MKLGNARGLGQGWETLIPTVAKIFAPGDSGQSPGAPGAPGSPSAPITVSPAIQTQVSPQISPVFQQQFQPTGSPITATTRQIQPTTQTAVPGVPSGAPSIPEPAMAPAPPFTPVGPLAPTVPTISAQQPGILGKYGLPLLIGGGLLLYALMPRKKRTTVRENRKRLAVR